MPLFHTAHYTRTFERGAECMHEVRTAKCGGDVERGVCSMHVVVGAKGLRTMTVEHGWGGGEGIIAKHEKRAAPQIAGEITAFEGTGKMELRTI